MISLSRLLRTKTEEGQTVHVGDVAIEGTKITTTRYVPKAAKWALIVGAGAAVLKTAYDVMPKVADSLINNFTVGYANLASVAGPDPESTRAKLVSLGVMGAVAVATWAAYQYPILGAKRNVEKTAQHAKGLAVEDYNEDEGIRQSRQAVRDAEYAVRSQEKIRDIQARGSTESTR